jgi:plasmid maintenance system antidote protein VapI
MYTIQSSKDIKMASFYPNREGNFGKRWTNNEETQLLQELEDCIHINEIAKRHNRSIGGITCRIELIAENMYKLKVSIEEIVRKTKLSEYQINHIIENNKDLLKDKINRLQQENTRLQQENIRFQQNNNLLQQENTYLHQNNNLLQQENYYLHQNNNLLKQENTRFQQEQLLTTLLGFGE